MENNELKQLQYEYINTEDLRKKADLGFNLYLKLHHLGKYESKRFRLLLLYIVIELYKKFSASSIAFKTAVFAVPP